MEYRGIVLREGEVLGLGGATARRAFALGARGAHFGVVWYVWCGCFFVFFCFCFLFLSVCVVFCFQKLNYVLLLDGKMGLGMSLCVDYVGATGCYVF